jgi:DNA-binding IclR family transcriptional regulator
MTNNSDQYFSKTLEKGMSILNLFDREHTRLSLTEISKLTSINKTSTFRFVNTLIRLGYLRKNANNKSLKLGTRALLLGHNFLLGFDLLHITKPLIDRVFAEHNITIDSALLDGLSLYSLYRREAPNTIFFRQPLVSRDLYSRAMGKAVLAKLDPDQVRSFLESVPFKRHTPKTKTDIDDLLSEIDIIKNRGYAINNEEYMLGLICIGAPLMNFKTDTVLGAISFDFPITGQSLTEIEQNYTRILTKLASDISEAITIAEN